MSHGDSDKFLTIKVKVTLELRGIGRPSTWDPEKEFYLPERYGGEEFDSLEQALAAAHAFVAGHADLYENVRHTNSVNGYTYEGPSERWTAQVEFEKDTAKALRSLLEHVRTLKWTWESVKQNERLLAFSPSAVQAHEEILNDLDGEWEEITAIMDRWQEVPGA